MLSMMPTVFTHSRHHCQKKYLLQHHQSRFFFYYWIIQIKNFFLEKFPNLKLFSNYCYGYLILVYIKFMIRNAKKIV